MHEERIQSKKMKREKILNTVWKPESHSLFNFLGEEIFQVLLSFKFLEKKLRFKIPKFLKHQIIAIYVNHAKFYYNHEKNQRALVSSQMRNKSSNKNIKKSDKNNKENLKTPNNIDTLITIQKNDVSNYAELKDELDFISTEEDF